MVPEQTMNGNDNRVSIVLQIREFAWYKSDLYAWYCRCWLCICTI